MKKLFTFILIILSSYSYCGDNESHPLLKACKNGYLKQVEEFLNKHHDSINEADYTQFLFSALFYGHTDIAELLLKNGARLNKNQRYKAIILASLHRTSNTVEFLLLKCNVDPNTRDTYNGRTLLMNSANEGDIRTIEILLKNKANINLQDKNNETALMLASAKGHKEVVKLLMKNNADINAKNIFGKTALILAVENNHIDVVVSLLTDKIDIDTKDNFGNTVLDYVQYQMYKTVNSQFYHEGIEKISDMIKCYKIYQQWMKLKYEKLQEITPFVDVLIDTVLGYEDLKFSDFYQNKQLIQQALNDLKIANERIAQSIHCPIQ